MYGKFFASTFTGSMYGKGSDIFALWGYIIANAQDGLVELNPDYLAAVIGMDKSRVTDTISMLCGPDPKSRTKTKDGRRLVQEGQFQYRVVNHLAYRAIRNEEERRAYNREKQREHRERVKQAVKDVIDSQSLSTLSAQTETEAESEANKNKIMGEQARPSPLPDVGKNRDSKKVSRIPNGSSDSGFQRLRSLYPKRDGDQRWAEAEQHYRARLKEGVSRETIEDGVMRYAKYCKLKGIEGKEFVQQAATFLGRNRGYAAEWKLPAQPVSPFE